MTASLVFCTGPLTILGSLSDGLGNGADQLYLKATLDGFAAIAFAASFGWGVAASALTVLVVQGTITAVGAVLGDVLSDAELAAITAAGGLMLVGVALRLLRIREIAVADLLPGLVVAPLLVAAGRGVPLRRAARRRRRGTPPSPTSSPDELLARCPDRTISPVSRTWAWSARRSACAAFCSTSSTVVPCSLISAMIEKICWISFGARPIDGSSSSTSRGRAISARPMASICCSPPDSVPADWLARSCEPREQLEDPLEVVAVRRGLAVLADVGAHVEVLAARSCPGSTRGPRATG